jgi:hypothetical protein
VLPTLTFYKEIIMIMRTIFKPIFSRSWRLFKHLCLVGILIAGLLAIVTPGRALITHLEITTGNKATPNRIDATAVDHLLTPDPWVQTAWLAASDATGLFSWSVSVDGDTVVVGAPGDDERAGGAGAVYVFVRPGGIWTNATEVAKLTASDGAVADGLGISVSISGDTIVAGASGDGNNGSAYVFVRPPGGWIDGTETAKLTASDGAFDEFGISVAVSGDTILIGARRDDADRGSAYVFERPVAGWDDATEDAKLTASDGESGDFFGNVVAIDGNTAVIGAHGDDDNESGSGSAYVFVPSGGWADSTETAKLTASDGQMQDFFGWSVAVSGNTVVVGAKGDDIGSHDEQGSAYLFESPGGSWSDRTETAKLTASDGAADDEFGHSVAISGDMVVVGAHWDDWGSGSIFNEGSAYVFDRPGSGWANGTETARLTAAGGEPGDEFGHSVAISGDTLMVGAIYGEVGGSPSLGSVYVFEGSPYKNFIYIPFVLR